MKYYDLPNKIETLEFDGDKKELKLHFRDYFSWGAETEEEYQEAEEAIDYYQVIGKGFQIYMYCDISGYIYWMQQQKETNYINITVVFDSEEFDEKYLPTLEQALKGAQRYAEELEDKYSFTPEITRLPNWR